MIHYKKLPDNFKNFVRRQLLKRVIPCAVLFCGLAVILAFFGKDLFPTDSTVARYSFYLIVLLIPFVVTGVPFKLIDRSYCGTVEKVTIKTTTDNSETQKLNIVYLYVKNTVYLSIRLKNGKRIRKKVYEGKAKHQQHLDTYQTGDLVFHLYGSPHTIVIPDKKSKQIQCPICGDWNEHADDSCRHCGGVLVKKENLEMFV